MFQWRKEPRTELWALPTVAVEERTKNSQGTWEEAARKVRDILAVCPGSKEENASRCRAERLCDDTAERSTKVRQVTL